MLEEKGTYTDKWYFENFKCLKKIKAKGDFKAGTGQFNLKQKLLLFKPSPLQPQEKSDSYESLQTGRKF